MADLAHAVMQGSIAAAQKLIKAGNVDINRQDKDGRTAADLARARGQPSEEQVAMLDEAVAAAKEAATEHQA